MFRLKSFSETDWTTLAALLAGGPDLTGGGVTVYHYHSGVIEVEEMVDATPGSPSTGEYYLFSSNHPTYPDNIAYYDGSAWEYYAPTQSSKVYNKAKKYFCEYKNDGWYFTVDMRMFAATNNSSTLMVLESATYPILEAGETWAGRIDIAARCPGGMTVADGEALEGHWGFDFTACRTDGTTNYYSHINALSSPSVTAVYTPASVYTQPSMTINNTTGALEITVGHTTTGTVYWTARISADVASSRGAYVAPA